MKNFLNYTVRKVDGRLWVYDDNGNMVYNEGQLMDGLLWYGKLYFTIWGVLYYIEDEEDGVDLSIIDYDGQRLLNEAKNAVEFNENDLIGWKTPSGDLLLPPVFDQIAICDRFVYVHYAGQSIKIFADHIKESGYDSRNELEYYFENGKIGLKNGDGSVLFPAIYDDIYRWNYDWDVYYTRISDEFHYYNSDHKEILTTYRKFDGVDDNFNPYHYGCESNNCQTIVTKQLTNNSNDPQSCVFQKENVRLDRILKSDIADIVKNNCEVWNEGIKKLDDLYSKSSKIHSAFYAWSNSTTPIEDCLNQFTRMMSSKTWKYIFKIWTNRNTTISIAEMNKLVYFLQDLWCGSGVGLPMRCITIGYDDSLEDGTVKMFQVLYHNSIRHNKLDDIYEDAFRGSLDNYLEKKQLMLDTLENYHKNYNWTDDVYQMYYNHYFTHNAIYDGYHGRDWKEGEKLLDYLADKEHYSVEQTAVYLCRQLYITFRLPNFDIDLIHLFYQEIKWAIKHKSCLTIVLEHSSAIDWVRRTITDAKKDKKGPTIIIRNGQEADHDSKIAALKEIEQLLLDNGALTETEIRRKLHINPLNMYYLKNDKDKPIAEHIDKCRILYEAWEMQCCGFPIEVGERITLHGAKIPGEYHYQTRANDADYFHQHHLCEEFMYDLCGKVESIVVIYGEAIDGKIVEKERKEVPLIDGWTEGGDPDEYIITLSDVSVVEKGYILWPSAAELKRRREIAESLREKNN